MKALEIAPDASALHIMSKDYDNQAKKFNNFYYQLSFDRKDYTILNEEIDSLDYVTAICQDAINPNNLIIANRDGFKISALELESPLDFGESYICQLAQSPAY